MLLSKKSCCDEHIIRGQGRLSGSRLSAFPVTFDDNAAHTRDFSRELAAFFV